MRRSYVTDPKKIKSADFLIQFTTKRDNQPKTAAERKAHIQKSKTAWFGITGAGKKNK